MTLSLIFLPKIHVPYSNAIVFALLRSFFILYRIDKAFRISDKNEYLTLLSLVASAWLRMAQSRCMTKCTPEKARNPKALFCFLKYLFCVFLETSIQNPDLPKLYAPFMVINLFSFIKRGSAVILASFTSAYKKQNHHSKDCSHIFVCT